MGDDVAADRTHEQAFQRPEAAAAHDDEVSIVLLGYRQDGRSRRTDFKDTLDFDVLGNGFGEFIEDTFPFFFHVQCDLFRYIAAGIGNLIEVRNDRYDIGDIDQCNRSP